MQFLFPAGLWALSGLAVILLLYILKRRSKPVRVASTLLWRRVQAAQAAARPFQKLRRSLLLLLQLLCALVLALCVARPALLGGQSGEILFVMDVSASMQTVTDGRTRLEEAVDDALTLCSSLRAGDRVSILTAGAQVRQVLSRSEDMFTVKSALRQLACENGGADMDGALSLARAMAGEIKGLRVVVYTDKKVSDASGVTIKTVGSGEPNTAILSLTFSQRAGAWQAFARIANYGGACEAAYECYVNGALCDVRVVSLPEGGEAAVTFSLPGRPDTLCVRRAEHDALAADDARYAAYTESTRYTVTLSGDNLFLEKALLLRDDITLVKATADDAAALQGVSLYVLDGQVMQDIPDSGAILAVNPPVPVRDLTPGETVQAEGDIALTGALPQLSQGLSLSELSLRAYRPLSGGTSLMTCGGDALCAVSGDTVALSFDVHDSNLPLKADFPVLVQNILRYLLPQTRYGVADVSCGDTPALQRDTRATDAYVLLPDGTRAALSGSVLRDTPQVGVYTYVQALENGQSVQTRFAAHVPLAESDVRVVESAQAADSALAREATATELTPYLLMALLLLLLTEWRVSRRGA